jgi:serine O-acetyltransferase
MLLPPDPDVQGDRARYGPRPALREQSWWAVRVYRFGRQVDQLEAGLVRSLLGRVHWALDRIVETLTGITLPKEAVFGPGLRIHHFGAVVVHRDTVAGAGTTLRQGVTLGERDAGGRCARSR